MRYSVNAAQVSHDRLQDEVIVINAGSGAYYSGSGPAADVWTLISRGATVAEAAGLLAAAYATDQALIAGEVDICVRTLLGQGLIQEENGLVRTGDLGLPDGVRGAWAAPAFDEYTDMWELIKLDPIHEVDEVGWPVPKA
jgi:hypothetical protein